MTVASVVGCSWCLDFNYFKAHNEGLDEVKVLAPDVVVVADGGGVVSAARHPIQGAGRVAGLLLKRLRSAEVEAAAVWINGSPAFRLDTADGRNAAVSVAIEDGRITRIYVVANPHKLA